MSRAYNVRPRGRVHPSKRQAGSATRRRLTRVVQNSAIEIRDVEIRADVEIRDCQYRTIVLIYRIIISRGLMPAAAPTAPFLSCRIDGCDRARWFGPVAGATRIRRVIMAAERTTPNSLLRRKIPCSAPKNSLFRAEQGTCGNTLMLRRNGALPTLQMAPNAAKFREIPC